MTFTRLLTKTRITVFFNYLKQNASKNNIALSLSKTEVRNAVFIVLVSLLYGTLTIIKTLYIPDCYGFEANDEIAHTSVDFTVAKGTLNGGEIPLINLFDNFGTPLIGDPVSNPFAIHAISYYILPFHIASTLNRFILVSLGVFVLIIYFKKYFSTHLSSLLAILVMSLPSYFHFLVHHPHQGLVFYFVLIILMQRRLIADSNKKNISLLYISIVIFFLSVGVKGAHYAIPFIILNQIFISKMKCGKNLLILSLCMIAAYVFIYPHFSSFYRWATLSTRAYIDYPEVIVFSVTDFIKAMFFFRPPQIQSHIGESLYFSIPVAGLIIIGLMKIKKTPFGLMIIILGFMPFLIVNLTELSQGFRTFLTMGNKPFDLSSVWWISNIYLMLLVGYALSNIKKLEIPKSALIVSIFMVVFLLVLAFTFHIKIDNYIGMSALAMFVALILLLMRFYGKIYLFVRSSRIVAGCSKIGYYLIIISLGLAFIPPVTSKMGLNLNHLGECSGGFFFNESWRAEFHPKQFINNMEPYNRMTAQVPPVPNGYDQWAGRYNIFGSNGRSIMINWNLTRYLEKNGMINIVRLDQCFVPVYYFTSQDSKKLDLLGIKYVITNKEASRLTKEGWKILAFDRAENLYLYMNPKDVSPIYLKAGDDITYVESNDITYKGNSIYIHFPEVTNESSLVATFTAIPGWKAQINGRPADIQKGEDPFLHIKVRGGDKSAVFKFEPYTPRKMLMFCLLSIVIMTMTFVLNIDKGKNRLSKMRLIKWFSRIFRSQRI